MVRIGKDKMREAEKNNPGCTRRLAKWLKMRNTDQMSDRQVICLLDWYFKRRDKKMRGLTWGW